MGSLHPGLACCSLRDGHLEPLWFSERDAPWLRELIEVYESFVGERRRLLDARLRSLGEDRRAFRGLPLATVVLDRLYRSELVAAIAPVEARRAAFTAAARREDRTIVLERVATSLGIDAAELEDSLLADLPSERRLKAPEVPLDPTNLALCCNLAIAQAALKSSSEVSIRLEGNARAVVRHAKLRGLICLLSSAEAAGGVTLEISGPLSLFRRTALYGRQLAELVPMLSWSRHFELRARCLVSSREGCFTLRTGAPLPAGPEPRLYDSALERRFAREFTRAAPSWELLREPEPVEAEGTLIFPDFAIQPHGDPSRRWLLEIVGFWTAGYIEHKLRRLRAASLPRLILCLDADRDCGEHDLPRDARVVRFRKRIDPGEVLALVERVQ